MNSNDFTRADLLKAIKDSGYPFELQVASELLAKGYEVRPTHRFFSASRQKDLELDILAIKRTRLERSTGPVEVTLQLAIECKDNTFPYVLFGLPHHSDPLPGSLDPDGLYCHVQSTDDTGVPSQLSVVAFAPGEATNPKAAHHQFCTFERFHLAAAAEPDRDRLKLNVSERLRTALSTLGEFLEASQQSWFSGIRFVKSQLYYNPMLVLTFPLLLHAGSHLRVAAPAADPIESTHTSVFTSLQGPTLQRTYVVDFVAFSGLSPALATIEASHEALARHLVRYLKVSRRPPKA